MNGHVPQFILGVGGFLGERERAEINHVYNQLSSLAINTICLVLRNFRVLPDMLV